MNQRKSPSDRELAILEALWERGPSRIRELAGELYGETSPSHIATVQSLLERLETKQLVERDRSGFAHVFTAIVDRGSFIGDELKRVADKVCGGSLTPLLLELVDSIQLTDEERDALLRRIDEAHPESEDA